LFYSLPVVRLLMINFISTRMAMKYPRFGLLLGMFSPEWILRKLVLSTYQSWVCICTFLEKKGKNGFYTKNAIFNMCREASKFYIWLYSVQFWMYFHAKLISLTVNKLCTYSNRGNAILFPHSPLSYSTVIIIYYQINYNI